MEEEINLIFKAQQAYKYTLRKFDARQRIERLKNLKRVIEKYEVKIYKACLLYTSRCV